MVEPQYSHTCDIYRLVRVGNRDTYGDDPVYSGIAFQILPAGPEIEAVYGSGPTFSLYELYTGKDVTLKNGDRITSGDESWIIKGEPQVVTYPHVKYVHVRGQKGSA